MLNYRKDNEKGNLVRLALFVKNNIVAIVAIVIILIGVIWSVHILLGSNDETGDRENNLKLEDANTVYLAMPPANSYDPLKSDDFYVIGLSQLLYRSLFQLNDTLAVTKDLVSSYTGHADTGIVEITLQDGVTFSDGTPLNTDDVSFTINAIKQAGASSPYYNYVSKIKTVNVADDKNMVIEFNSASDGALDNLIFPIVSSDDYKDGISFSKGSGAYAIDNIDEKKITLKFNDKYQGEPPKLPVEVSILNNPQLYTGLISMEAITASFFSDAKARAQGKSKDLSVRPVPSNKLEYIGFNYSGNSIMSRAEMRQAVSFAIDSNQLIEDNYAGEATKSETLFYPNFLGTEKENASYNIKYDPKEAVKKMKSAGLNDKNEDGIMENSDGSVAQVKIIVSKDYPSRADAATQIQENLTKLGLTATIEVLSSDDFWKRISARDYDIFIGGLTLDKQFKMSELFGANNIFGYRNQKVEMAVAALETTLNEEDEKNAFIKLKEELYKEMPYIPLCYCNDYFISVNSLKTNQLPIFFSPFRGVNQWTWKKKVKEK